MNSAELDRLWQRAARKIVSAEIATGRGPVSDQSTRIMAKLDDGSQVELFYRGEDDRPSSPADFIGLTVAEARALKFTRSAAGASVACEQ